MYMAVQKTPLAVFHFTRVFSWWVSTIDKNLQWLYKLPERIELYRQPGEQTPSHNLQYKKYAGYDFIHTGIH